MAQRESSPRHLKERRGGVGKERCKSNHASIKDTGGRTTFWSARGSAASSYNCIQGVSMLGAALKALAPGVRG